MKTLTEEQQRLSDACTKLQRLTVINRMAGMAPREAYYAAGGRAKKDRVADACALEILANPNAKAFYDSLSLTAAEGAILSKEKALEILSDIASSNIADVINFHGDREFTDDDGNIEVRSVWSIKDSDNLSLQAARSIKSVTMTKFGPKIELHDQISAMKTIASMVPGWLAPAKQEVTGAGGAPLVVQSDVSAPEIAAALTGLMDKL